MKFAKLFAAAVGVLGIGAVQAATITMVPTVTRSTDLAGGNVVNNPSITGVSGAGPRLYEITLNYTYAPGAAQGAFAGVVLDAKNLNGVSRVPAQVGVARPNYVPNNPLWTDSDGASHTIYDTNGDLGTSTDFIDITGTVDPVGTPYDPAAGDPRPALGVVPTKLGAVWVRWDDTANGSILINPKSVGFVNVTSGQPQNDGAPTLNAATVNFTATGTVPEPAALSLLGLAGLAVVRRRQA